MIVVIHEEGPITHHTLIKNERFNIKEANDCFHKLLSRVHIYGETIYCYKYENLDTLGKP